MLHPLTLAFPMVVSPCAHGPGPLAVARAGEDVNLTHGEIRVKAKFE